METYRPTKAIIDLGAIRRNTARILQKYPGYRYYMAVVKADSYGFRGEKVIRAMLDGGANCFAASLLEEGLALRQSFPEIPILLFNPVIDSALPVCAENRIWVTAANERQASAAAQVEGLQVLIRANGGSDILGGPTDKEGFHRVWDILSHGKCRLTGVYLHSYNAEDAEDTRREYETFETMTEGLDLSRLEIVSISNSLTLPRHEKKLYCNGCRFGNLMYSIESEDSDMESAFRLCSRIVSVFSLKKGQSVAYSHAYTAKKDNERIAAIPIGFGDGFAKMNIGRDVFIHGRRYPIVAITMDVSHILVDDSVADGDEVVLIRDSHHLNEIAEHIHGAPEESVCALNKRVYREYID